MYTAFAEIYDELMADVDYDSWAAFYREILSAYGIAPGAKVCECACGTGSLTLPLRRVGYVMTGVDLSQDMLWVASQKARAAGAAIPFICQDMRSLRLHRPMDAVIATCDGVNYLTSEEDLRSFLRAAWRAIRPGGALIFDVSTPHKLRDELCAGLICEDQEDITYFWQNRWNPRTAIVDMLLCFFIREEDGRYRRMEEEQRQRAWEAQELKSMLLQAGFRGVCIYGDGNLNPAKESDLRWHICATRPADEN